MVSFRGLSRKPAADVNVTTTGVDVAQQETLNDGDLKFTVAQGENGSLPSYQEASGAPVETHSPLGYHVGPITIIFLNISMMIGTGVYSTPSGVLKGCGSVGLTLIYWFIGFLIAASAVSVYIEFASYFPSRSGAEAVYLEQAYTRPKFFFPLAFAFQTVILSFSSGNSLVLAEYLWRINGAEPSPWQLKGTAIAAYTVAVLILAFNTRLGFILSNVIGVVKVVTLLFVSITGLVVLGGHTSVKNPHANFKNAFDGTTGQGYGVTNALLKIIFSYTGYANAFNVVNEVKNPVRTMKINASIAVLITATLYVLANIAYFAAVPKEEILQSKQVAASLFFEKVFGSGKGVRGLNFLIAVSAFGNLVSVLIGQSRLIRECGRQGVLPFPSFWASTRPFNTPLGPYTVKWAWTLIMIMAPPAGDAFNFAVDLQIYPLTIFNFLLALGIYFVRYRRHKLGLPRAAFRAWDVSVIFNIVANLFVTVMPWYPPAAGRYGGDVSFWYGTYVVVGISILVLCGIYHVTWIHILPRIYHYRVRPEVLSLDGSAATHRLTKVPVDQIVEWDRTHDAAGRKIDVLSEKDGSGSDFGKV